MKSSYLFVLPFLLSSSLLIGQQVGSLDSDFGTDGKVSTLFYDGSNFFNVYESIYSMGLQSDGKIIAVGGAGGTSSILKRIVARYNSNGQLDTSFGTGGTVLLGNGHPGNVFLATAVQPDDKIVAVGRYDFDFTISRFNSDGSLDTDFGPGGIVSAEYTESSTDNAFAVALQADGKIVVGGNTYNTWETPWSANFLIVRYNPNGTPDMSFGTGGTVVTDFNGQEDHLRALAIQPDGKILAGGDATNGGDTNFAIARYNTDGSLDTDFGDEGKVETNIEYEGGSTSFSVIRSLTILDDGKILATGSTNAAGYILGMARFNSDGSLDTGFGEGGKIMVNGGPATKTAVQPDGKIVAAGGFSDYTVARYNADGSKDVGFGDQGQTVTDFENRTDQAQAILLQPDGKIILAGSTQDYALYYGATFFGLARYHGGISVGTEEATKQESGLRVYPNPVRDILHIEAADRDVQKINLFSIAGQKLGTWEKQSFINMAQFAAGVYFVEVSGGDGTVEVVRVVND